MWEQAEKATDVDELPTPFEISELGRDFTTEILGDDMDYENLVPTWAGKSAMLTMARGHKIWTGAKTLPPMGEVEPAPEILPMVDLERQIRQRSMVDDVNMLDGIDDIEAEKIMAALSGSTTLANGKTYAWRFEDSTAENFSLRSGAAEQRVFRGFVYDENERMIGRITREVTYPKNGDDPFVYNALAYISPGFTGQGIGTELTQHIEDYWIAHDLRHLKVNAGETIGGYAWARAGFDWDPDNFKVNQQSARYMLRVALDEARGDEDTIAQIKEMMARTRAAASVDEMPTPFEISEIGRKPGDTTWPGKRAMMGTQWSGVKTLPPMTQQRPLPAIDMTDLGLEPPNLTDAEIARLDADAAEVARAFDGPRPDIFIDPAPTTPPPPTTRFRQVDLKTELAGAMMEPIRRRMEKRAEDPIPDETYNWRAWRDVFDTPLEERDAYWGNPFAAAAMDVWGRGNPGEPSPFGAISLSRNPPSPEGREAIDRILDVVEANPKIRAAEDRYGTVPIVGVDTLPYGALGVYMTDVIAVNPSAADGFEPNPLRLAENVDLSLNGTLRHEYGHHVHSMLSKVDRERWSEAVRAWGGNLGTPEAVNAEADRIRSAGNPDPYEYTKGLSFYGRTNELEAFGETFALVTHPDYDPAKVDPRIKAMTGLMEEFVRPSLAGRVRDEGGFTISPRGESVTSGFSVATPGRAKVIDLTEFDDDDVTSYIDDNWDDLQANPDLHVGAWYDTETGDVWLDVPEVFQDRAAAIDAARERGELAIFDLSAGEEIRIPYKSQPPSGPAHDAWGTDAVLVEAGALTP